MWEMRLVERSRNNLLERITLVMFGIGIYCSW